MLQRDFEPFNAMLGDIASLYGKSISATQAAMYFRVMASHSIEDVQVAFDAHAKDSERGRFMPLPADLLAKLERIQADDGRPTPEEAWSIAIQAQDEALTVVWTTEASQAWADVGQALMEAGDRFNASRGFIDRYTKLVAEARRNRQQPHWIVSQGYDKNHRHQALEVAYKAGRIGREVVRQMLPRHDLDTGAIVAAIAGQVVHRIGMPTGGGYDLDRVDSIVSAGDKHQQRIADLRAALAVNPEQKTSPKSPRDSLRIFEEAEAAGVFIDAEDKKIWLERVGTGDRFNELQGRIFDKRASRKQGAA